MRILFITIAFAPNEFSESIVNSKLVLAFRDQGYYVDVISRGKHGVTYSSLWNEPWLSLKENTYQIEYNLGSKLTRFIDTLKCSFQFRYPLEGVRWVKRAYNQAENLILENNYDIIITRSPSDVSHIVGLNLKKKYNIPWIANWNDPSNGIMPFPYKNHSSSFNNCVSKYYTQKILKKADMNTFPSERLRSYFEKFYSFKINKTEIIPHIGMKIIKEQEKTDEDDIVSICHAGSLSIERNPEMLLKNIARLRIEYNKSKIKLTIIGIADIQLNRLINKYNLQEDVLFADSKPYVETLIFMQKFDVLCVVEAKMDEGIFLPSKLSDYSFLNKPILCFSPSKGTLIDIINQYGAGLAIDNENDEDVYNGLKLLVKYKENRTLSKKIKNDRLNEYLGIDSVMSKYESVFKLFINS
jgi:glycosyltransferase involved in cell wall biosynthesis